MYFRDFELINTPRSHRFKKWLYTTIYHYRAINFKTPPVVNTPGRLLENEILKTLKPRREAGKNLKTIRPRSRIYRRRRRKFWAFSRVKRYCFT